MFLDNETKIYHIEQLIATIEALFLYLGAIICHNEEQILEQIQIEPIKHKQAAKINEKYSDVAVDNFWYCNNKYNEEIFCILGAMFSKNGRDILNFVPTFWNVQWIKCQNTSGAAISCDICSPIFKLANFFEKVCWMKKETMCSD